MIHYLDLSQPVNWPVLVLFIMNLLFGSFLVLMIITLAVTQLIEICGSLLNLLRSQQSDSHGLKLIFFFKKYLLRRHMKLSTTVKRSGQSCYPGDLAGVTQLDVVRLKRELRLKETSRKGIVK